jgi:hypothetical protein
MGERRKTDYLPKDYFTIRELAYHSGLGERYIRDALKNPAHPLPSFRLNHKTILIAKSEFNEWLEHFRVDQTSDLDSVVNLVLAEFKK